MAKKVTVRVDIDTITDCRAGLESLQGILSEFGIPCTFFVNMGKAVDRTLLIRDSGRILSHLYGRTGQTPKIPLSKKYDKKDIAITFIFNPAVVGTKRKIFSNLLKNGNEFGLHGGRNHSCWMRRRHFKSKERICEEILWGRRQFKKIFEHYPEGFSCPGFVEPAYLGRILRELGFLYHSDSLEKKRTPYKKDGVYNIPVNICGPDSIPMIEYLAASGYKKERIGSIVMKEIEKCHSSGMMPVLYLHPAVEGRIFADFLVEIIKDLLFNDYQFITFKDILLSLPATSFD